MYRLLQRKHNRSSGMGKQWRRASFLNVRHQLGWWKCNRMSGLNKQRRGPYPERGRLQRRQSGLGLPPRIAIKQAYIPDWTKFRQNWQDTVPMHKHGYQAWSQQLLSSLRYTETRIQLSEVVSDVDNHRLQLWEARHSLLADSNWVSRCSTFARQMSSRNTWRLFHALIDLTQTRTETQKHLQRAVHGFAGNTTLLEHKVREQYLCTTHNTRGTAYSYAGSENAELDQPFQLYDLKTAPAKMKQSPKRDLVSPDNAARRPMPRITTASNCSLDVSQSPTDMQYTVEGQLISERNSSDDSWKSPGYIAKRPAPPRAQGSRKGSSQPHASRSGTSSSRSTCLRARSSSFPPLDCNGQPQTPSQQVLVPHLPLEISVTPTSPLGKLAPVV
ncbi:hypothetical protein HPB49_023880 [Dermacentor silvarum]|uniref:Uncharacterized protein n=1 Tax=Dermacentor silvarum TaxID=543639 RepID=A0ACB8D8R5_DERSI|nr:hypothetical protein HPB49_023880 [Dermacentor silvarum]